MVGPVFKTMKSELVSWQKEISAKMYDLHDEEQHDQLEETFTEVATDRGSFVMVWRRSSETSTVQYIIYDIILGWSDTPPSIIIFKFFFWKMLCFTVKKGIIHTHIVCREWPEFRVVIHWQNKPFLSPPLLNSIVDWLMNLGDLNSNVDGLMILSDLLCLWWDFRTDSVPFNTIISDMMFLHHVMIWSQSFNYESIIYQESIKRE